MKRSRINALIDGAIEFLEDCRFSLPPFAFWSAEDWSDQGDNVRLIIERGLGWDVTDFGLDRFDEVGLLLFTLRNGTSKDLSLGSGMLYAEKILLVQAEQITPMHYHVSKTEDIINRSGGHLAIQLFNATESGQKGDGDVSFLTDGVVRTGPAGTIHRLLPGCSITLPTKMYHSFWAEKGRVLAGEISTVNDDTRDNCFLERVGRFPRIEEDERARYLLVSDYASLRSE